MLIIFLIGINITYLKADCESDKEAVKDIKIIKKNYVVEDKYIIGFEIYSLKPADLYVEFTEGTNDEIKRVEMKDAYLHYVTEYDNNPITLEGKLYSKSCPGEVLDSFIFEGETLNPYSGLKICSVVAGSSKLCSPYANVEGMTEEEFTKQVRKDINGTMAKINFKIGIKKYIYLALIPFFVFGIGYMIAWRVLKEKRKNVYRGGGIK